jgi:hypothetical protein
MQKSVIKEFYNNLDEFSKKLVEHYIDNDYVPKVRTGLGKKNNFFYEHNSKKGVEIVREIIKFKKLQLNSGFLTLNSKKVFKFVTNSVEKRFNSKNKTKQNESKSKIPTSRTEKR